MFMTAVKGQRLKPINIKEKKFNILFGLALSFLFCWLCYQGPEIHQDSMGYIEHYNIRSPLYPALLSLYMKIFGADNFHCLVVLQLLLGFFACFHTASKLQQQFKLPYYLKTLITLVLFFPYYNPLYFGNAILTEAVCYPLFLLMFSFILEGLLNKNSKALMISLGFLGLLVLTRGQFLFLYPAFGIIFTYILIFERKSFKTFTLFCCFILTITGSNLIERSVQYINHGKFKLVPFTGIQLIIAPLFLARATDNTLFQNSIERKLFEDVWKTMEEKKINFESLKINSYLSMVTYNHYYEFYNPICWGILKPIWQKHLAPDNYVIDETLTHMALILIQNNLKAFFTLYAMNIIFSLGGMYFCLILSIAGISALEVFFKTRDPLALTYLLIFLLTLGNYTLVALVEPAIPRYTIYTDTLLICVLLIIVTLAFQRKTNVTLHSLNLFNT